MADREIITLDAAPSDGLVKLTHIIYGLHAFSIITGLIGAATIVGMFLTGWPSIIAVIINYVKRGDVKGTYLESHFRWQIRTFWYALLWCVVAGLAFVTLIGIPIFFVIVFALSIWLIYRIVFGWINLNAGKPMYS